MNLLGWAATFGADPALDAELAEPRADADAAANSAWVTPDRATLGVLFYRGCELLDSTDPTAAARARSLFKIATDAYRATGNRDLLPVAFGFWSEAERRCGNFDKARSLANEAADLGRTGRSEPPQRERGLRRAPRRRDRSG